MPHHEARPSPPTQAGLAASPSPSLPHPRHASPRGPPLPPTPAGLALRPALPTPQASLAVRHSLSPSAGLALRAVPPYQRQAST
ncbi:hypothetical protein KY284_015030 [Solanum tuberosum]|nr:hypothetical protein KY284_015030 [Solanum tuberosum]